MKLIINEIRFNNLIIDTDKENNMIAFEIFAEKSIYQKGWFKYRDFSRTRYHNTLYKGHKKVQDDKYFKDFNYNSIRELLDILENYNNLNSDNDYIKSINEKCDRHLLCYRHEYADVMLEIAYKIIEKQTLKAYVEEHKEELERQFFKDRLNEELKVKLTKTNKIKI